MKETNLIIWGASIKSAGIGGVTIHVLRLIQLLDTLNVRYVFCDYKSATLLQQLQTIMCHKVVHIHASNPILRILQICVSKLMGKRVVFTVHGNLGRFSSFKNWLDKMSIVLSNVPILINQGSYDKAKKWNKCSVLLSAFIPPIEEGHFPTIIANSILEQKLKGKTIIATNASVRAFTKDGKEIYGINFCVNYFKNLPQYYLCISDPSGMYTEKYREQSFKNIIFVNEQHSFYALMKLSDIFLRATATDGDSLSIKEGLFLHKKVIATDCVDRPKGVVLFKYNNASSLDLALKTEAQILDDVKDEKVVESLIDIYNKLIG